MGVKNFFSAEAVCISLVLKTLTSNLQQDALEKNGDLEGFCS
jgi:hypothetical protein